jgi:transaldolase/glucose-6-phosphate isomerase
LLSAFDAAQDGAIAELERAGHPVVRIGVDDPYDLGEEFSHWEFAAAVAGSMYERAGAMPTEAPLCTGDGIALFADDKNAKVLTGVLNGEPTLVGYLTAHLSRLGVGDYFALLAYVEMNEAHERVLQEIRVAVRDASRVANCLEFGPRFLHSTGQACKRGPKTGVFLQITCDDAIDLPAPGQKYTFGVVKAAQARGDSQVLVERNRRALRVHLGSEVAAGTGTLLRAITTALEDRKRQLERLRRRA